MCKQSASFQCFGGVMVGIKHDVGPDRVGASIHGASGFCRSLIAMNTDLAKIVTEAPFHQSAFSGLERLPIGREHILYDWWCIFAFAPNSTLLLNPLGLGGGRLS